MTHTEISNYQDLQRFIQTQIKAQVVGRKKTVEIRLNEVWFIKLAKFIQFVLKDLPEEKDAREKMASDCLFFRVKINGFTTTVRRI